MPEGSSPKQGPSSAQSAGVGIAGALLMSLVTNIYNANIESKKMETQKQIAEMNAAVEERKALPKPQAM